MKKHFVLSILLAAVTAQLFAQDLRLPKGKWWHDGSVARRLELTDEQIGALDDIAEDALVELIDLKASMQKAMIELQSQLDRDRIDRAAVRAAVERLNEARGSIFEREVMVLVSVRSVLNSEQWDRMRDAMHRRERMNRRNRRPPHHHPNRRDHPRDF